MSVKLHARVTREIEVPYETVKDWLGGNTAAADKISVMFREGISAGEYDDKGYIPFDWLYEDLRHGLSEHDMAVSLLLRMESDQAASEQSVLDDRIDIW